MLYSEYLKYEILWNKILKDKNTLAIVIGNVTFFIYSFSIDLYPTT